MYQVLRLLPELENFPTAPSTANQQSPASPKLKVVLEAIKQRKKEESTNQEIQEALDQAQGLARAQSALNSALRHPDSGSSKGSGSESPVRTSTGNRRRGRSKRFTITGVPQGKLHRRSHKQMAENENRLSEEARRLAEKLQRLAGENSRLGHNAGNNASQAASNDGFGWPGDGARESRSGGPAGSGRRGGSARGDRPTRTIPEEPTGAQRYCE